METVSIIGCGHLGKSLGRLWRKHQLLAIDAVLNRSLESARQAVDFIGQGRAVSQLGDLAPSDYLMISVPDDAIAGCCHALANAKMLQPGTIVFHCSGSLPSSILEPLKKEGAHIASLHPLRTFANPAHSADTFAGTPCGIEGDPAAREKLAPLMAACGAKIFDLNPQTKLFYHAGTVMMCNYLTALIEAGMQCYERAGIPRNQALELAGPILEETLANNFKLTPAGALTGPISRGDAQLVTRQMEALSAWNPMLADLYKAAGLVALELAHKKGSASNEALEKIKASLTQRHA